MAVQPLRSGIKLGLRGLQGTMVAGAPWWGTPAMMLRFSAAQGMLLRGLAWGNRAIGSSSSPGSEAQIAKAARAASVLGLVSAGGAVIVTMYYRRTASHWDAGSRRA